MMKLLYLGRTFSALIGFAALTACGGDDGSALPKAPAVTAAASILDVSDTAAVSIRDNMSIGDLGGQQVGSSCRVITRPSPSSTVAYVIGNGYPEPEYVDAGDHVDFFDSAGDWMLGFEALKTIKVTTISDQEYQIDCG